MNDGGAVNDLDGINVVGAVVIDNGVGIDVGVNNGVSNGVSNGVDQNPPIENVGMFDQTPPIRDVDISLSGARICPGIMSNQTPPIENVDILVSTPPIAGVVGTNGVFNNNGVVNDVIGVNEANLEIDPEIILAQTPPIENVGMLDQTPPIGDIDTPNHSFNSLSDGSGSSTSLCGSDTDSQSSQNEISANDLLKNIRIKNVNRLIIRTLNINFIAPKFEQLK